VWLPAFNRIRQAFKPRAAVNQRFGVALLADQVVVHLIDVSQPHCLRTRTHDAADHTESIDTAFALLEQLGAHAQDTVHCVISDRHAIYTSIPWTDRMMDPAQAEETARIHLSMLDPQLASQGEIRIADAPYGTPRIACAVFKPILDALRTRCLAQSINLATCLPMLSACTTAVAQKKPQRTHTDTYLVACLEQQMLSYAYTQHGLWHTVGTEWLSEPTPSGAQHALARLRLRHPHWPDTLPTTVFDTQHAHVLNATLSEQTLTSEPPETNEIATWQWLLATQAP